MGRVADQSELKLLQLAYSLDSIYDPSSPSCF